MTGEGDSEINFCVKCGAPVNLIPNDAHKDFTPDLSRKTRQELQAMKTKQKAFLADAIRFVDVTPEGLKFDWEKKDWFEKLKKLKF